jgi:hypothetical protein
LENRILEEMFAVLEPSALAQTAQALSDAERSHAATLRGFELSVEQSGIGFTASWNDRRPLTSCDSLLIYPHES